MTSRRSSLSLNDTTCQLVLPSMPLRLALFTLLATCCLAGEPLEQARADLQAVITVRDRLLAALNAARPADGPGAADLSLEATSILRHQPLRMTLHRNGNTFAGGRAYLTNWNAAVHSVDASGLRQDGDRLHGTLLVTLNPDPWVPADHQPRTTELTVDARIDGSTISGIYRATGELGPEKDRLVGSIAPCSLPIAVAGPSGAEELPAGEAGLHRAAELASLAYRQLWAAALALRNPELSFESALAAHRISPPRWDLPKPEHATPQASARLEEAYTASKDRITAEIQAWLGEVARIATAFDPTAPDAHAVGFCHAGDPNFGPYFDASPLAQDGHGTASLPADVNQAGPQRWQYIPRWKVVGPFPSAYRSDDVVPQLPQHLPQDLARHEIRTADFLSQILLPDWISPEEFAKANNSYTPSEWVEELMARRPPSALIGTALAEVESGRWGDSILPPRWGAAQTKVPTWGVAASCWYAHATLDSSQEQTVWAEARPEDAGQVWVNNRLAWISTPDLDGLTRPKVSVFPLRLVAGNNRIVIRCRTDDAQTRFRLLLCTRGVPADAATIAARTTASAQASGIAYNFRGNGTGAFPAPTQGRPPIAWNVKDGTNLRWRTETPSYGNAFPVIVGERMYITSEPHRLLCLDKMDGRILWSQDASIAELLPEAQRAAAHAVLEARATIYQSKEIDPALAKLIAERTAIEQQLRDGGEKLAEAKKAELTTQSEALQQRIDDLSGPKVAGSYKLPASFGGHWTGLAMSTPATDGKHIWVRYGTGIAACYDLDGNRQWMVDTGLFGDIPCVSSPVVIGDVMVIEGPTRPRLQRAGGDIKQAEAALREQVGAVGETLHFVLGLDARTGKELWCQPVKCGNGDYGGPAGPRGMRLPLREGGHLDLVLSYRSAFRAIDGMMLNDATGTSPGYKGFTIGNRSWHGCGAADYWAESMDQIGLRHVLSAGSEEPVLAADGWLWSAPGSTMKTQGGDRPPWMGATAKDASTGAVRFKKMPVSEGGDANYVPVAACGDVIYLTNGNCNGSPFGGDKAEVVVIQGGPQPQILARSKLGGMSYTAPVFDGDRAYIRTRRAVLCLQTTTEAGRDYEYQASVRELFDSVAMLPQPPAGTELGELTPAADYLPGEGVPVSKAYEVVGPSAWLAAGPFGLTDADPFAAAGGAATVRAVPGMAVGTSTFQAVPAAHVTYSEGMSVDLYSQQHWTSKVAIDMTALAGGKGEQVWWFFTVVEATRVTPLTYVNDFPNCTTWLSGQPLKSQQVVRLGIGYHPLLLRVQLPKLPPFATGKKLLLRPNFIRADDPNAEFEQWRAQIRPYRARLEEAKTRAANGDFRFKAELFLSKLGPE